MFTIFSRLVQQLVASLLFAVALDVSVRSGTSGDGIRIAVPRRYHRGTEYC